MLDIDKEGRMIRKVEDLKGLRKIISDRMTMSILEFPQGTGSTKIEVSKMKLFKQELKEKGINVTFGDLYIKAAAMALEENMGLNGARIGDEIQYYDNINIGIMVSTKGVLMEAVLEDVQNKNIEDISIETKKMYEYLEKGRLMKVKLDGATFSISNLGMYMIDVMTPLLSPPKASILGIGCVRKEAGFSGDDKIVPVYNATLNLTTDHGMVDGILVAKYFKSLNAVMQNPWEYMYKKRDE